jgi:hypothetical protein
MSSHKKVSERGSPSESATAFSVGTIKRGNDGNSYVVTETSNKTHRWIHTINAEMNNMKLLTVDYLAKNINKPIKLYLREYRNEWAKKNDWSKKDPTHGIMIFKPTGNAIMGKKILPNWLKTRKPEMKDRSQFSIEGHLSFSISTKESDFSLSSLQVDSKNKKLVSYNLMNTEVFIESK